VYGVDGSTLRVADSDDNRKHFGGSHGPRGASGYRRPTAITTNRPFKDWTKVFPDALNAQVIAERLTERAETFVFEGRGYRDPR